MLNNKISGYSLSSLMISLTIGIMVLLLLTKLFFTAQANLHSQQVQQKIYAHAQQVEQIFREAIQHAGYFGCKNLNTLDLYQHQSVIKIHHTLQIYAGLLEKQWQPQLPATLQKQVKLDTDVLNVSYLNPHNSLLENNINQSNSIINLQQSIKLKADDLVALADCHHGESFILTKDKDNAFPTAALQYHYDNTARFGQLINRSFFISKTSQKYPNGEAIYALYQKTDIENKQELVPGINNLTITASTNGKDFIAGNKVKAWQAIKKIKIIFTSQELLGNHIQQQQFEIISRVANQL